MIYETASLNSCKSKKARRVMEEDSKLESVKEKKLKEMLRRSASKKSGGTRVGYARRFKRCLVHGGCSELSVGDC